MKEKSNKQNTAETVRSLIEETVNSLGYLLWDVEYKKEGASWNLTVTIDKDGDVTIDDWVAVNNAVNPILDEKDPIPDSYYLEVSSAGLERELREEKHFIKYMNEEIQIRLFTPFKEGPLAGKKTFCAKLLSYEDGAVTVLSGGSEIKLEKEKLAKVCSTVDYEKIFKKE